jgi:protein phosphatase
MSGSTDLGRVRQINEDSFRLIPERDSVIVCDGMGGHAAGEVASRQAVETVVAFLLHDPANVRTPLPKLELDSLPPEAKSLAQAVRLANRSVFVTAQSQQGMRGMGTTLVAARFWNGCVGICHVGDSRAYRFARGKLESLTTDHSLLAELKAQGEITEDQEKNFPERNVITRALGTRPSVAVDVNVKATHKDDWFILCSDGLCGYIGDPDIERVLVDTYPDHELAINRLIGMANEAGGHDNCTVAIAVVAEPDGGVAVNETLETVPESTPEEGPAELAYLNELGLSAARERNNASDVDTNPIRIVSTPPNAANRTDSVDEKTIPPGSDKKRKGGFWPWSNG